MHMIPSLLLLSLASLSLTRVSSPGDGHTALSLSLSQSAAGVGDKAVVWSEGHSRHRLLPLPREVPAADQQHLATGGPSERHSARHCHHRSPHGGHRPGELPTLPTAGVCVFWVCVNVCVSVCVYMAWKALDSLRVALRLGNWIARLQNTVFFSESVT